MHVYRQRICIGNIYNIPLCLNKTQEAIPRRSGGCRTRVERRNRGACPTGVPRV